MRCTPCEVSWVGPDPCWMCGQIPERERGRVTAAATVSMSVDTSPFVRTVSDSIGVVRGLIIAVRDCAIADELVRLTLGGRGPARPELRVGGQR